MTGFLPPSLLQALKDFDPDAPEEIITRVEALQKEQHRTELIDRQAFKKGFLAPFRPAVFKALFETLANPLGGTRNIRNALELSTPEDSWKKVWDCYRQAINEYIDENDFPRDSLGIGDLAWLYENPSRELNASGRQPRV